MNSNDRLYDLKAGGAFLVWNVRDYPATCLVMLAQALCYATFRLCQAGKLPFQFQVKFFELYDNRLLSTEAMAEGRYYTLITCILFLIDWIELLSAWVGLWFILFRIEYAFRWYTALLVLLLPCAAGNATFLVLASWAEAEAQGGLVGIRLELLELCRPERNVNVMPWRLEPLWWGMAAFALIRLPTVRVLDGKVPMWLFVAGMLAVEFTIIRWNHGQNYSRESFVASAVAGVLVACLGNRLRQILGWLMALSLAVGIGWLCWQQTR